MIKKVTLIVFSLVIGLASYGQNIKTGVLVVGSTPAAMAAAIQSAKSGVKTVLVDAGNFESITLSAADRAIKAGIYTQLRTRIDSLQKFPSTDTQEFLPTFLGTVFKGWTDTVKNLTVLPNSAIKKIEKGKKGWEIELTNREIKADVILDATPLFSISKMAALSKTTNPNKSVKSADTSKLYRTSVAVSVAGNGFYKPLPLSSFIFSEVENVVLAAPETSLMSLSIGQAAGAIAAYCSFFNTHTGNVDVRKVQSELLTFKGRIIGFADIPMADSATIAFQHIGVTGIIKGRGEGEKLLFQPEKTVSTEELRQPFREYYSRSQIWFLDNKSDAVTLAEALSLIKFTASRAQELDAEVEKGWTSSLKFKGNFDLKRVITRRELAVLLDRYLQPFNVSVDLNGNVRR